MGFRPNGKYNYRRMELERIIDDMGGVKEDGDVVYIGNNIVMPLADYIIYRRAYLNDQITEGLLRAVFDSYKKRLPK